MVDAGLRVHATIAVWVLQHCLAPAGDVERIRRSLAVEGYCFVLNMRKRAIPAIRDKVAANAGFVWASDAVDVATLLRTAFGVEAEGEPDKAGVPNMAEVGAYWMSLRPRGR
jgi:hypothetical protein